MELPSSGDGATTRRPRSRWNIVLAGLCALLLIGAASVVVWGRARASEADDFRAEAADLGTQHDALVAKAADDDARRRELKASGAAVQAAFTVLDDALDAAATAQNDVVDLQNKAVEQHDAGHEAAAVDLLRTQGDPLLDTLTRKVAAVDAALADLQAKSQQMGVTIDG